MSCTCHEHMRSSSTLHPTFARRAVLWSATSAAQRSGNREKPPPLKNTTFGQRENILRLGALRPSYCLPSDSTPSSNCVLLKLHQRPFQLTEGDYMPVYIQKKLLRNSSDSPVSPRHWDTSIFLAGTWTTCSTPHSEMRSWPTLCSWNGC